MRSRAFASRAFAFCVGVLGLFSLPDMPQAASDGGWTSLAMGFYGGRIVSNSEALANATELRLADGGRIVGEYTFTEKTGERVTGSLNDCSVLHVLIIECQWNDRYGEGTVDLVFSRDLSSFVGRRYLQDDHETWSPVAGTRLSTL